MGFKTMKWDGTYAAVLLGSHFTPTSCFRTLYVDLPIKMQKTIITQKVLVTQSSNIVHYDQHTQKPVCADLQAFANAFSLCKLTFFSFFVRRVKETAKISHFVDFDWKNTLKLLEWHIFRVQGMPNPMALVASLYDKQLMKNHNFRRHIAENGVQNHEMGWDICSSPPWVPFYPYIMFQNPISRPSHKNAEKP